MSGSGSSSENMSIGKFCQLHNLNPVKGAYSILDFQKWQTRTTFLRDVIPMLKSANKSADEAILQKLSHLMWDKFSAMNPLIILDDTEEIQASVKESTSLTKPKAKRSRSSIPEKPQKQTPDSTWTPRGSQSQLGRRSRPQQSAFIDPEDDEMSLDEALSDKSLSNEEKEDEDVKLSSEEANEEESVDDNQEWCEECGQCGEIILCDTCPRSYHAVCANITEVPQGDWSCPYCQKHGPPSEKEHKEFKRSRKLVDSETCAKCRNVEFSMPKLKDVEIRCDLTFGDAAALHCCVGCTHWYHAGCIDPNSRTWGTATTSNRWKCPRCVAPRLGSGLKPHKIFAWRWKNVGETSFKEDTSNENKNQICYTWSRKEFLVKFAQQSYWHCRWMDEYELDRCGSSLLVRCFFRKADPYFPTEPLDDETCTKRDRLRFARGGNDKRDLFELFFRWGISPSYLKAQRFVTVKAGGSQGNSYLVKWYDLGYEDTSWEIETDLLKWIPKDFDELKAELDQRNKHFARPFKGLSATASRQLLKKHYTEQPKFLDRRGKLHPYQLEGLNWLRFSYGNSVNTILADEMGLGKTIQTIAFLCSLYAEKHCQGPFLITAPLSTIPNWAREFEFWTPDMVVVTYYGIQDARLVLREYEMSNKVGSGRLNDNLPNVRFHVLLTSYEFISVDQRFLQKYKWQVLVVDEAHRLKNNQSKFFRVLNEYRIEYKCLLTGTPLQNNLEELFNLLRFMEPETFNDLDGFLEEFSDIGHEEQVKRLHDMLGKHLLRRLKADVLKDMPKKSELIIRVDLSNAQKTMYRHLLTRNFEALRGTGPNRKRNPPSLMNILMHLRKCCNHPYLFQEASDDAPLVPDTGYYEGNELIKASGKLQLLQLMLRQLYEDKEEIVIHEEDNDTPIRKLLPKHRVLIFSQMTRMLDVMEDFLYHEKYEFERIDGGIIGHERQLAIDRFNAPSSESFVFLLSTRAGGLGINLASADTVFILDSDWNPHNDIQAFSRAHRIGQRNKVMVYRFVTRNTVEEQVIRVAQRKMMLNHVVVTGAKKSIMPPEAAASSITAKGASNGNAKLTSEELDSIIRFGSQDLFASSNDPEGEDSGRIVYDEESVRRLLDRDQEDMMPQSDTPSLMNEYFSSFKVAHYELRNTNGAEENIAAETEKMEVETAQSGPVSNATLSEKPHSKDTSDTSHLDLNDPLYWEKLLLPHCDNIQNDALQDSEELGKGMRQRRPMPTNQQQVTLRPVTVGPDVEEGGPDEGNPFEDELENGMQNDVEDDDEDEQWKASEDGMDVREIMKRIVKYTKSPKPPLLIKLHPHLTLVLGFTPRQRIVAYNAIMLFGLPPNHERGFARSRWIPPELSEKPLRVVRDFYALTLRHLRDNTPVRKNKYSDGCPTDNVSREMMLTRIGMIGLIRAKVAEYESFYGPVSIPSNTSVFNQIWDSDPVLGCLSNRNAPADERFTPTPWAQFCIEEGGLTELIKVWEAESIEIRQALQNFAKLHQAERQKIRIRKWHRWHDYWLLTGIITHGYGMWEEILQDPRFSLLVAVFPSVSDILKEHQSAQANGSNGSQSDSSSENISNFPEITKRLQRWHLGRAIFHDKFSKIDEMNLQQQLNAARSTFLAQRLRMLEQALLVEDHLRQIVRNMGAPLQSSKSAQNTTIASSQKIYLQIQNRLKVLSRQMAQQGPNKAVNTNNPVIQSAFQQLREILIDIRLDSQNLTSFVQCSQPPPSSISSTSTAPSTSSLPIAQQSQLVRPQVIRPVPYNCKITPMIKSAKQYTSRVSLPQSGTPSTIINPIRNIPLILPHSSFRPSRFIVSPVSNGTVPATNRLFMSQQQQQQQKNEQQKQARQDS